MKHYSRQMKTDASDLQPGDLIDTSALDLPYWVTVTNVAFCDEESADRNDCDGDCYAVISYEDDGHPIQWHLDHAFVSARLLADTDGAGIGADNDAHSVAVAARAQVMAAVQ